MWPKLGQSDCLAKPWNVLCSGGGLGRAAPAALFSSCHCDHSCCLLFPSNLSFCSSSVCSENLPLFSVQFSSVAQSCPTLHDLMNQHARPPCPSPTPRVYPNPCPLSRWCHPTISSSIVPFSSCPQSFSTSDSFKWVSSSHRVAKVLEFQLQNQSYQWTPRTDLF